MLTSRANGRLPAKDCSLGGVYKFFVHRVRRRTAKDDAKVLLFVHIGPPINQAKAQTWVVAPPCPQVVNRCLDFPDAALEQRGGKGPAVEGAGPSALTDCESHLGVLFRAGNRSGVVTMVNVSNDLQGS